MGYISPANHQKSLLYVKRTIENMQNSTMSLIFVVHTLFLVNNGFREWCHVLGKMTTSHFGSSIGLLIANLLMSQSVK